LTDFRHILKYKILRKFVHWVPRFSMRGRTDRQKEGQTGRHDEANSRFSQLCDKSMVLINTTSLKTISGEDFSKRTGHK